MPRQKPSVEHAPETPPSPTKQAVDGYDTREVGGVPQVPSMSSPATRPRTGPSMSKVPVEFDDAD